jgi:glycosyltransferase involved in cell wall biosynthesis
MPRITVILPVYNAMPHLRHAVESLQSQTLRDFEVIVFDDGSTDGSPAYLSAIADTRFKITTQENAGLAVTLNRMLDLVETEYVARLDSDDICLPQRLDLQLKFLDQHPDVAVVGTRGGYIFGAKSRASIGFGKLSKSLSYAPPAANPPYWDPVGDGGILIHSTVMMRTEAIREVGGYPEIVPGQDLALWHVLKRAGKRLANINETLLLSRVCRSGISSSNLSRQYQTWHYIGYESDCLAKGLTPKSMREYMEEHPLTEENIRNLAERAKLRNSLADILNGKPIRGIALLIGQLLSNPGIILERIKSRI